MILLPQCSLVGSGYLGFGLTDPWDSHVFLVMSEDEALLIDTGCGRDSAAIARNIEAALRGGTRLVGIALTHGHVDHSGGAAELSSSYDVPVYASPTAAARVTAADEEAIGLLQARADGIYPPDLSLRSTEVTPNMGPIRVGGFEVRVHPTPGHSADHVVYSVDFSGGLAVFSGDLVFGQGRIAPQQTADADLELYESSVRQVNALRPEYLFPGHGNVALSRGWAHLAAAVDAYDIGATPAGLVT